MQGSEKYVRLRREETESKKTLKVPLLSGPGVNDISDFGVRIILHRFARL